MRFLDYNGSGGLDSQDIATSVVEEAAREEKADAAHSPNPLESNAGCATTLAFMALPILAMLLAL